MRLTLHPTPRCSPAPRTRTRAEHSDNASQSHSLLDWVINNRRLSERDVRPLAQQLARTLSLIHAHGVVHRSTVSFPLPHDTHINRKTLPPQISNSKTSLSMSIPLQQPVKHDAVPSSRILHSQGSLLPPLTLRLSLWHRSWHAAVSSTSRPRSCCEAATCILPTVPSQEHRLRFRSRICTTLVLPSMCGDLASCCAPSSVVARHSTGLQSM